jgi:hypothetical protein
MDLAEPDGGFEPFDFATAEPKLKSSSRTKKDLMITSVMDGSEFQAGSFKICHPEESLMELMFRNPHISLFAVHASALTQTGAAPRVANQIFTGTCPGIESSANDQAGMKAAATIAISGLHTARLIGSLDWLVAVE